MRVMTVTHVNNKMRVMTVTHVNNKMRVMTVTHVNNKMRVIYIFVSWKTLARLNFQFWRSVVWVVHKKDFFFHSYLTSCMADRGQI
jgi:hypothetical protein